jgi:DNA-binding NtrC family response regulator
MYRILVVDDEDAARYGIRRALESEQVEILEADTAEAARAAVQTYRPELMLADINMPGEDGISLLKSLSPHQSRPLAVMITAYGTAKVAVEAMKAGAYDYITKPFEIEELRMVVRRALEKVTLEQENQALRKQIHTEGHYGGLIGKSKAMQRVFEIAEQVAATDVTLLIQGESGTGKELMARAIHERSSRRKGPFVAVNCAALPDTLIESELFGHEKGAFTGAGDQRKGKFEQANGGTVLLDEIGDMNALTQAKVLRVLEERKIERLGGSASIPINVRVISASHRNLLSEAGAGRFREDLLYRLKVVSIDIPPLRKRKEDLPLLIQSFLEMFCLRHKKQASLVPEAIQCLTNYHWPGNIRELRNVIEGCLVLNQTGLIQVSELPPEITQPQLPGGIESKSKKEESSVFDLPFKDARREFETLYLQRRLNENQGNVSRTATQVGLHRQSLQQKMKELGIQRE